jgi:hypothetical protein
MTVNTAALERALSQGITARRTSARCWMASSASGRGEYEVIVDGAAVRCRCMAGLSGKGCKHAELVRVLDASGAVPIPERRVSPADATRAAAILGGER